MKRLSASFLFWLFALNTAAIARCETILFESLPYTVCEIGIDDDLRLFLNNNKGERLGSFGAVNKQLAPEGKKLAFAMNAGMFHPDRRPVGLYIEKDQQFSPLEHGGGYGNFGLAPNGVFCIQDDTFSVITSETYESELPHCTYATQSGPMLVIEGELHPRFIPNGDSKHYRNGVGVSSDGQKAFFAISERRVNFHDFARMFRDELGLPHALFFDGKVSRLFAPEISRNDLGFPLGPIVGAVTDR